MQLFNEIEKNIDNLNTIILDKLSYSLYSIMFICFGIAVTSLLVIKIIKDVLEMRRNKNSHFSFLPILSIAVSAVLNVAASIYSYKNMQSSHTQIILGGKEIINDIVQNEHFSDIQIISEDEDISISFLYDNSKIPTRFLIKNLSKKDKTELLNYANNLFAD